MPKAWEPAYPNVTPVEKETRWLSDGAWITHNRRTWVSQKKLYVVTWAWLGRGPVNQLMPQFLCSESLFGQGLDLQPESLPLAWPSGTSNWCQALQPHQCPQPGPCFLLFYLAEISKIMRKSVNLVSLYFKKARGACGQERERGIFEAQKVLCTGNFMKKIAFDLFV